MDKKMFNEIMESMGQAVSIAKGKTKPSRIFEYKPVDIKRIREKLHFSQNKFAHMIGVSPKTLQNWEQGRREPTRTAQALLRVFESNPTVVVKALHYKK